MYTLHSDEVVSLLISGCEIVVYSCSPMAVTFYALLLNRWFISIDINPRISLDSVVKKNAKQIFIWLKKNLIFSQIG